MLYKILEHIIETISWILIFLSPAGIFGAISFWIYGWHPEYDSLAVILLVIGTVAGIILAKYVRRTYGCYNFLGAIGGSTENLKKKN
jgi:hypothetical protein